MSNLRSADRLGVVVEMTNSASAPVKLRILACFNKIVQTGEIDFEQLVCENIVYVAKKREPGRTWELAADCQSPSLI